MRVESNFHAALARHLWEGLTGWVNRKRQVPNKRRIEAFANDLCEYEVGAGLLGWWALGWWVCLGRHWMEQCNAVHECWCWPLVLP